MRLFAGRRNPSVLSYDRTRQLPVIRASICTGEQVAGFKDVHTGHFEEVTVIRKEKDLKDFLHRYGIDEAELRKEW